MKGRRETLDYEMDGPAAVSRGTSRFSLLGGGIAWFIHLIATYIIGEFGCVAGWGDWIVGGLSMVAWSLLLATVLTAALAGAAALTAVRSRKLLGLALGDDEAVQVENRAFVARIAFLANGVFLFVILVQAIPIFHYLKAC
jgi:hypothetical protein